MQKSKGKNLWAAPLAGLRWDLRGLAAMKSIVNESILFSHSSVIFRTQKASFSLTPENTRYMVRPPASIHLLGRR